MIIEVQAAVNIAVWLSEPWSAHVTQDSIGKLRHEQKIAAA
jgi:hypothetical protein